VAAGGGGVPLNADAAGARIAPRLWILLGKGVGGNRQMLTLGDALGWPYEAKQLVFNRRDRVPNVLLGDSLRGLDRQRSSPLTPPWPDLVIAASRRSAPVALWIRARAGGATRLVHLMHTQAPLDWFDLVITMPQYRLPERANVLHVAAPLVRLDQTALAAAARRFRPRWEELPRPHVALLVGGNSSTYELDAATAARLGREASAVVRARGGSLLVSTSARTPAAAANALAASLACPAVIYNWRRDDPDNPYFGYLALADAFIVTVDSASLLAEACATGKPVFLFEWPRRRARRLGRRGLLERWGDAAEDRRRCGATTTWWDRLVYWGLVKPPRDFDAYRQGLITRGLVTRLGEEPRRPDGGALDDMERAVAAIHRLWRAGCAGTDRESPGEKVAKVAGGGTAAAGRHRLAGRSGVPFN
jgi:hypothetical protein